MMTSATSWRDGRRFTSRVETEALCTELIYGHEDRFGLIVDVSEEGLRVERPFVGGRRPPAVQLEIDLPGIDEILWARGEVCSDQVRPGGAGGLVRSTGIRLAGAATRDLRLIRDWVSEMRRTAEMRAFGLVSRWSSG